MSLTAQQREQLIQTYAGGPSRLEAALNQVPEAARRWSPGPGKWSVHQVVCHCADSEMNGASRIRFVLAETSPTIMGYDQDRWADVLEYDHHPIEAALTMVRAARDNTVPLLRRQTEEAWRRSGTHTELGSYSAESWLQIYAEHLETHARQIERNLAAWRTYGGRTGSTA